MTTIGYVILTAFSLSSLTSSEVVLLINIHKKPVTPRINSLELNEVATTQQ